MCIYILFYQSHPDYPVILAGNRDEFYERKALPVHRWKGFPDIAGGIDLREGGSWLAAKRNGEFAVVTNYRDPANIKDTALSRGTLVSNFLTGDIKTEKYLEIISENAQKYNGYNLIIGNRHEAYYYSNIIHKYRKLSKGIYMLSNHVLDTPWYKTLKAKELCLKVLSSKDINWDGLLGVFTDKTPAPDDQLPDTGVGYRLEKMLSSIFIESNAYGTMVTTLLTIDNKGKVNMIEKTYKPSGRVSLTF